MIHVKNQNHTKTGTMEYRRNLRYFAAGLTAVTTLIYFLIGFNVITVIDTASDQIFGIFAGLAYALGVVLLLRFDQRRVWIVGAAFQIFVIFTYFNLASERSPAYEMWGILLRFIQFVLLLVLVHLISQFRPEAHK